MEIWLDGVNVDLIKWGGKLGILHGVTTNPSIISASGKSLEETLGDVLKSHHGPTAVQILAEKAEDIVEQAETLRDHSENIIVKIPITQEGLKAMHALSHLQLPIMATGILTPFQLLLACHAGATFLAPYYTHLEKTDTSSDTTLNTMIHIVEMYGFESKIVVASIDSLEQISTCLKLGAHAVTIKPELFTKLISDHPMTLDHVKKFHQAAKEGIPSRLISI